jgi:hypothetical protein
MPDSKRSRLLFAALAFIFLLLSAPEGHAQCRDAWVSQAVKEVMDRPAVGSADLQECNYRNYNGGSWKSYPELKQYVANAFAGVCRDAWVTQAVTEVRGRRPQGYGDTGECNYRNYGGGSWSGYPDLKQKVQLAFGISPQPVARPATPAPVAAYSPQPAAPTQNSNVPACPQLSQYGSLATVNVNKYANGAPMPSCGGIQGNVRFTMVWTGSVWAKYGPSIQVVTAAVVAPAPLPAPKPVPPTPSPAPKPAPTPPAPTPQPPAPTDPVVDGTIAASETLPAVAELQSTAAQGLQYVQNLSGLYTSMEAYTTGPDALYDPATVKQCEGAVAYIQYLLGGSNNPYSLKNIASGGAVALNSHERQMLAMLLANDPDVAALRENNLRLARAEYQASAATFAASGYPAHRLLQTAVWRPGASFADSYPRAHFQTVSVVNDDLNFPAIHGLGQPLGLTGLDRANHLAATLSYGQSLQTASTFMTYSLQVEPMISLAFNKWAAKVFQGNTMHIGEIGKVLKIYTAVKLTVQLTNVAVNFLAAVTPSSISNVYMNLGNRTYQANLPPWPLNVNSTVNAQIYVVPHMAGGTLVTPLGAINIVIDAGLGPVFGKVFAKAMSNKVVAKQIQDTFVAIVEKLGKFQVDAAATTMDNYGPQTSPLWKWAHAGQNPLAIPKMDFKPIEINDTRLIQIPAVPHIDVSQGADHRFIIKGVDAGSTRLVGTLNKRVPYLTTNADRITFIIAIQVNGPSGKPVYQPCGKPGDGGIIVNGKCTYPD